MGWTNPKTWAFQESVESTELNTQLRDNLLAAGPHLIARKTSDQSVTSSTTLVDCTSLVLAVGTTEVWRFELQLYWAAATTGDLKWSFTWPAGATAHAATVFPFAAGGGTPSLQNVITSGTAFDLEAQDTANNVTMFYGLIVNGGTAGSLQFQFAQKTSSGTATTVKTNSTLWAVKLA